MSRRSFLNTDRDAMLRENLLSERVIIQVADQAIGWLGTADATSRRLVELLLATAEGHAGPLRDMLSGQDDADALPG